MTENTVLPLINTAFEPGNARKAAESFADRDFREIAIADDRRSDYHGIFHCHAGLPGLEQPGDRRTYRGILKHSEALSYRYL